LSVVGFLPGHSSILKMEAVRSLETFVIFDGTTRRHIPEDSSLHSQCSENLKSSILQSFFSRTRKPGIHKPRTLICLYTIICYKKLQGKLSDTLVVIHRAVFYSCHLFIHSFIDGSTDLYWAPGHFFSFPILFAVGRTPWTRDQPVARPLPTHRTAQKQNKRRQTSMPQVGFEPTPAVFDRMKTVHA
jgi:hypothetical protein